jgi:hypothetical protein
MRGHYQQAQDQCRDGGNQAQYQLHCVLRFGILMMCGEPAANSEARQRPSEHKNEYEDGEDQGIHRFGASQAAV